MPLNLECLLIQVCLCTLVGLHPKEVDPPLQVGEAFLLDPIFGLLKAS